VPIAPPQIGAIGQPGGTLTSLDGRVTLTVPAGTVSAPTEFSIQEVTNMAPGGVGSAYRLGPEGTTFSTPVTITIKADLATASLDALTIAYQEGEGYWIRLMDVARDAVADTLTATATHFSGWTIVAGSPRDLSGSFTFQTTIGIPFSATGLSTFNFAGTDASADYFLQSGTITVASIDYGPGVTCVAPAPELPLFTNVADLRSDPVAFWWGFSGHWNIACTPPQPVPDVTAAFDTAGINLIGCNRGYVGVPVLGPDRVIGTYTIDCGASGAETASWDFRTAICGTPCASTNPCHIAAYSCASGTAVCSDVGIVTPGTSCGTDMVCNDAGACISCTAGLSCTGQPDPLCHEGVTSCATGASACVNGSALANGTSCGTDMVCNGGSCVSCIAGASCAGQPDPLCHAGVTSCATGTSTCVDGAPLANGTSCGTNMVCNGGACGACTQDDACISANPCAATATIECSSGVPVCTDRAFVAPGTSCGTNQVCSAAGACGACTQGAACTSTNPCAATATDECSSGVPVCTDRTFVAPGTSCGTDQVCSAAGACNACTAGQVCTSANPCHTAAIVCTSGSPVCTDSGNVADGTTCGAGQTCNAGACVASRTVTATRRVTNWPDPPAAQATAVAPDAATASVEALAPDGSGGWVHYPPTPATFDVTGSASIANVPAGSYLLVFRDGGGVSHVVQTSWSAVDLGYDVLGRADAAPASLPTPVSYALTGLAAGATEVQVTSSNADVAHVAELAGEDWAASGSNLLAAGDVFYVHDLAPVACGAYACQVATDWSSQVSGGLTDGAASTIAAALAPATTFGSVTADWQTSAFELLLAAMNPVATTDAIAHTLLVGASAYPLVNFGPFASGGAPVLFQLQQPAGTGNVAAGVVGYGQFLDPVLWNEWRGVGFSARVAYTAPLASTPLIETVSVARREPMIPAPATPIAPTLGPAQTPLVNGLGAFSTLTGVGLTPTFSWSAPATGVPTSYQVSIYRLFASGTASASALVASLTVAGASTQVAVPPGLLLAGDTYYARITAQAIATGDAFDTAPFRTSNVWATAQALTGTFSP
jgi:hypothetical protein